MSLINATFLVNSITNKEQFVIDLPENYEFGPGERLIQRQITAEQYNLYLGDRYKHLKIYRYVDHATTSYLDKTIPPKGLDYKVGLNTRLFTKPTIANNGFLTKMEYFADGHYNPAIRDWVYSDLILEANFTFNIDPDTEYVVSRTKELIWYKENGEQHPDRKTMFKPYSLIQMDEEAIRRRSNVVALIKIELAKFNAWAIAQQFPDPAKRPNANNAAKGIIAPFLPYLMAYINAGDKSIIPFVQASTMPFLEYRIPWFGNQKVRDFIIGRIS